MVVSPSVRPSPAPQMLKNTGAVHIVASQAAWLSCDTMRCFSSKSSEGYDPIHDRIGTPEAGPCCTCCIKGMTLMQGHA